MMQVQMPGNAAQVHPVHIHLDRLLTDFFGIGPGFGFWSVLDLAEHAAIPLAAARSLSSSVLAFGSVTVRTFNHALILAHFLATPQIAWFRTSHYPECIQGITLNPEEIFLELPVRVQY